MEPEEPNQLVPVERPEVPARVRMLAAIGGRAIVRFTQSRVIRGAAAAGIAIGVGFELGRAWRASRPPSPSNPENDKQTAATLQRAWLRHTVLIVSGGQNGGRG